MNSNLNNDYYDIKYFLTSLHYTTNSLNNLEKYEKDFLIQRAKELNINGMKEFLETKNFKKINRFARRKEILEVETGIIYKSITNLAKDKHLDNSYMCKLIKTNPDKYIVLNV